MDILNRDIDLRVPDNDLLSLVTPDMDLTSLLRSLFDTELVAICVLKAVRDTTGVIVDFRIELVNQELQRQSKRSDLVGLLYSELHPGFKQYGLFDAMVRVHRTGKPKQIEHHYQNNNFDNWYQSMFVKTHEGIVATNLDITTSKKAELKAKDLDLKRNQELYQATIAAEEKERKRIAQSLHNGVGQLLYAAKLSFDSSRPETADASSSHTLGMKLLSDAIRETRRISHILSPTILEDFGLKSAIEDTCDQFRSIAKIKFTYKGKSTLNDPIQLTIYRTIQELLLNMAKHSNAKQCFVDVCVTTGEVILLVKDDGIGFNGKVSKGLGLHSIKNQIKLLQGEFCIESIINSGTKIRIQIPVTEADY